MDNNTWTDTIINLLQRIKYNSMLLHHKHRHRYMKYRTISKYFDLPIIIMSVFSSSFSSLNVISSDYQNIITTAISMAITILSSTKLYLNLSNNITSEIDLSKAYYILSINIFKMIMLKPPDQNPNTFLDASFAEYSKLIETSSLLYKNIKKDLLNIDEYFKDGKISDDTSSISSDDPSQRTHNILLTEYNHL